MSTLSASLSASFVLALVGCSSSPVDPPVTRTMTAAETLAHLARFPEFAGHLGAGGALEASTQGFRLPKANALGSWTVLGGDALDVTLPKTAGEPTRIARADDADAWIELTAEGQRSSTPEVHGAALVLREVAVATDLVQVIEPSRFEEIRVLRTASAARATRYRVRRGPAIAALRVVDGRIEAVGADGRVRLAGAPSFAVDAHGTRRALETTLSADGATLALTLDPTGLVYPIAVDPLWTATPDLLTTRYKHGAAPLPDGRAMIAGGWRATGSVSVINTTFAFDGTAKTWTPLANMISPSDSFAFTVLSSGKLLVTGGNASGLPFRGASVYDPVANSWSSAGTFSGSPYQAGVVAALSGDRALAVSLPDALLWTLSTASFVAAGTTTVTHDGHTATTVTGDRVLVAGSSTSKETDLWDPTTKTFSNGGTMLVARANHTATLLPSGRVLFVGGTGLSTAELYDPATKKFSAAGSMSTVRTEHTATLLGGERLLVTGRQGRHRAVLSTTEIYDGATNTWSLAAPMSKPRVQHTATALSGSRVVVAGGYDGASTLSTAEVFEPYAKGIACAKSTDCVDGLLHRRRLLRHRVHRPVRGVRRDRERRHVHRGRGRAARAADGVRRGRHRRLRAGVRRQGPHAVQLRRKDRGVLRRDLRLRQRHGREHVRWRRQLPDAHQDRLRAVRVRRHRVQDLVRRRRRLRGRQRVRHQDRQVRGRGRLQVLGGRPHLDPDGHEQAPRRLRAVRVRHEHRPVPPPGAPRRATV